MAENDQDNEEYQFEEIESYEQDASDMNPLDTETDSSIKNNPFENKNIKRNALITIGVVVLLMVMYQFSGFFFAKKKEHKQDMTALPPAVEVQAQVDEPKVTTPPKPIAQETASVQSMESSDLKQQVASIEQSQLSTKAELDNMSGNVNTINSNMSQLSNQIAQLNQVISNLTEQVNKQSEEIKALMNRAHPVKTKKIKTSIAVPRLSYYLQAVIPGRAWLIASNGSTLTVREGTQIAGYGTVRLIDSVQGRVLTSSGRVIRFSQEDS